MPAQLDLPIDYKEYKEYEEYDDDFASVWRTSIVFVFSVLI
jgi:hypothetical protein